MLSRFASLKVNSGKHLCNSPQPAQHKKQLRSRSSGIARRKARRAQDDKQVQLKNSASNGLGKDFPSTCRR